MFSPTGYWARYTDDPDALSTLPADRLNNTEFVPVSFHLPVVLIPNGIDGALVARVLSRSGRVVRPRDLNGFMFLTTTGPEQA